MSKKVILTITIVLALSVLSFACTSVAIKTADNLIFYARTMEDHLQYNSKVIVVPKGSQYQGQVADGSYTGMQYKTRYGMVGMNTFDFPYITDGMNEEGLTAGTLAFPIAQYPEYDPKNKDKTISNAEVVTFILSQYKNVAEAREGIKSINVCAAIIPELNIIYPFHYVLHDPTGACIVIEYTNGKLNIYDNPLRVMTNAPDFPWMITNLGHYVNLSSTNAKAADFSGLKIQAFGQGSGMMGIPGDYTPPGRFARMVLLTQNALPTTGAENGLSLAMTLIDNVDIAKGTVRNDDNGNVTYENTQWAVVGDMARKRYYFRSYANKNWRYIDILESLKNTKVLKSINIDSPPFYTNVTSLLKKGMDDK